MIEHKPRLPKHRCHVERVVHDEEQIDVVRFGRIRHKRAEHNESLQVTRTRDESVNALEPHGKKFATGRQLTEVADDLFKRCLVHAFRQVPGPGEGRYGHAR